MKNILYIHGLDSSPKEDKILEIKKYGIVVGLHLNYRVQKDAFILLDKAIVENGITHIIGSSMGGYLGFYLAHKHQLPCLLFNPALTFRSIEMEVEEVSNECPRRIIVLGMKDDIINPQDTMYFIKESNFKACEQEIILNNTLEHQIPLNVFKRMINLFLA